MSLRRTTLVLYILFIVHVDHILISVMSSQPSSSSVATSHETLPFNASKPDDVVVSEGKARELAVVIKKGGGGGGGGRGGGGGGFRGGGGGRRSRGGAGMIYPGGSHSRHSSGNKNLGGTTCVAGWLGLSVLAGLFLV